jgi:gas vesicle protein
MLRRKNDTKKKIAAGAALAGITGYLAGILTAPKSGKETRRDLSDKAGEVKDSSQAQLESTLNDLSDGLQKAKGKTSVLNTKAKQEFDEAVVKAKDAQNKAGAVLKAAKAGEAEDPDLNKAIKQGRLALKNLAKYLKS